MSGTAQQPVPVPPLFRRRIKIIVVVLALGLVAWLAVAWLGRSQVQVLADEQPLTCEGTEVVVEEAIGDQEVLTPYAVMSEQMRCSVHFQVHNRGPLPVRLRAVSLPNYGPDGGMRAQATTMEPFQAAPPPVGQPFQDDAVFVPGEPYVLGGGEVGEFAIDLVYREPGCQGGEGRHIGPPGPVVEIRALGVSGKQAPPAGLFGLMCVRP